MIKPPPVQAPFDEDMLPNKVWVDFIQMAYDVLKKDHGYGTTADRPINGIDISHYYFDTTLGYIIHYDGTNWVDGSGSTV